MDTLHRQDAIIGFDPFLTMLNSPITMPGSLSQGGIEPYCKVKYLPNTKFLYKISTYEMRLPSVQDFLCVAVVSFLLNLVVS